MPRRTTLTLTPRQRRRLIRWRNRHPKAYLREKAAALLKIADGWSIDEVARFGLLRKRSRNSVASWLRRYRVRGLAGLKVRHGRGRKPAFSPLRTDTGPGTPSGA
jgi:hypothetical protein